MGKRKFDDSSSSSNNVIVKYDDFPDSHRRTWILDDNLNLIDEYVKLLGWMRELGNRDGSDFDGIRTLGFSKGWPFMEVEVVSKSKSAKFLITRCSLYIVGFYSSQGWRMFKDRENTIDVGTDSTLLPWGAKYRGEPWEILGPQAMIDGLFKMDDEDDRIASEGCEVFMAHLCEASRLKLIEIKLSMTMLPSLSDRWDQKLARDEMIAVGSENCVDVITSLKPIIVDLNKSISGDLQIREFIKYFGQLSKAWVLYVLSQSKLLDLEEEKANLCGIKFIRSLRHSLALLSNTNLNKICATWVKKFNDHRCPRNFQKKDLDFIISKIQKLTNKG